MAYSYVTGLVVGRATQPGAGGKHLDAIVAWYRLLFSHRREFQNVSAFFGGLGFSLDDLSSMDAHAFLAAGGSAFASLGFWGARVRRIPIRGGSHALLLGH